MLELEGGYADPAGLGRSYQQVVLQTGKAYLDDGGIDSGFG